MGDRRLLLHGDSVHTSGDQVTHTHAHAHTHTHTHTHTQVYLSTLMTPALDWTESIRNLH